MCWLDREEEEEEDEEEEDEEEEEATAVIFFHLYQRARFSGANPGGCNCPTGSISRRLIGRFVHVMVQLRRRERANTSVFKEKFD